MKEEKILKELEKACLENHFPFKLFCLYKLILELANIRSKVFKDGECYCFARNEYLANKIKISTSQISKYLKSMEHVGWIRRERNFRQKTTHYKWKKTKCEIFVHRKIFPIFNVPA